MQNRPPPPGWIRSLGFCGAAVSVAVALLVVCWHGSDADVRLAFQQEYGWVIDTWAEWGVTSPFWESYCAPYLEHKLLGLCIASLLFGTWQRVQMARTRETDVQTVHFEWLALALTVTFLSIGAFVCQQWIDHRTRNSVLAGMPIPITRDILIAADSLVFAAAGAALLIGSLGRDVTRLWRDCGWLLQIGILGLGASALTSALVLVPLLFRFRY